MSVCHNRTGNKNRHIRNQLNQDVGRTCLPWDNRTPSLQQIEPVFTHSNGTLPTQVMLQNETLIELPDVHQIRDIGPSINSVDLFLQRSLEEKVITEGPEKCKYFCRPCDTEILGPTNIRHHIIGKKHANFSFYEVMNNPVCASSVLKDLVPKVALDATLSQKVKCLSPSTFQCGHCHKVLNGVKPLVQHLDFHRNGSLKSIITSLRSSTLPVHESSEIELLRPTHNLLQKSKVLLLEYAVKNDVSGDHVKNLVDCLQQMDFELNYFMNLSPAETNKNLFDLFNLDNDEEVESFICILTGTGHEQTFYNSSKEAIKFSDVINSVANHSSPLFGDKNKVFIADVLGNYSVCKILGKHASNFSSDSDICDTVSSCSVPKNTTMIISLTDQDESILVPSLARNIKENPKLELYEIYHKICDDFDIFDKSVGRVEYQNHQARKFSFL